MYKLISYWTAPAPDQVEHFEKEYESTHIPLASRAPGVQSIVLTRTTDGAGGGDPGFYRTVEMAWDSKEDFDACCASEAWGAVVTDTIRLIEKYGVSTKGALGEPREYAPVR